MAQSFQPQQKTTLSKEISENKLTKEEDDKMQMLCCGKVIGV